MALPTVAFAYVPAFAPELFSDAARDRLAAVAEVLDPEPLTSLADDRALAALERAEVLLTGWGCPPLDADTLAHAPALRAIVHAAGTVKMHVTDACWDRDILVTSANAANAVPVAEFTVAAILFANKRVFPIACRYRQERSFCWWPAEFPGLGNYRKTVGIVGASAIGRIVIERLRPFDLDVLVYDPYLGIDETHALGVRRVELDELMSAADVVSLHAPALIETHHMINADRLARMRDGTTLINTARGWLVDADALERELVSGRIFAVIDTTEPEVLPPASPLYELPNVFLTPHIAGAMGRETQRMGELAVDEVERYSRGEPFRHRIRREDLARLA